MSKVYGYGQMFYGICLSSLMEVRVKIIICYDIGDNRLRYRLVKHLERFAVRVQYSVYKADLDDEQISKLNAFADRLLEHGEKGSFQVYKTIRDCSLESTRDLPQDYIIF